MRAGWQPRGDGWKRRAGGQAGTDRATHASADDGGAGGACPSGMHRMSGSRVALRHSPLRATGAARRAGLLSSDLVLIDGFLLEAVRLEACCRISWLAISIVVLAIEVCERWDCGGRGALGLNGAQQRGFRGRVCAGPDCKKQDVSLDWAWAHAQRASTYPGEQRGTSRVCRRQACECALSYAVQIEISVYGIGPAVGITYACPYTTSLLRSRRTSA
jgi:hypothetical protein